MLEMKKHYMRVKGKISSRRIFY